MSTPVRLIAQRSEPTLGSRVRVEWQQGDASTRRTATMIGALTAFSADSLVVRSDAARAGVRISRPSLTRFEISTGRSNRRSIIQNALLGSIVWGGLSVVQNRRVESPKREWQTVAWTASGAVVGGLLGARRYDDVWERVAP